MALFADMPHEGRVHTPIRIQAHRTLSVLQRKVESQSRTSSKDVVRAAQRAWLDVVVRETGLTLSQIAREAGVEPSTLTRFHSAKGGYSGALSPMVVQSVSERAGIAGPGATLVRKVSGVREDGEPYDLVEGEPRSRAIAALLEGNEDALPWILRSDVLKLVNIAAGDVLIIDQATEPRDGDVVCAQIEVGLGVKTVFRVFQRSAIIGASLDPLAVKPEIVDGSRVRIVGVMTAVFRSRT